MARMRDGINGGTLGTWIKLAGPESVEIMAYAGFDFVVIDLEHTALDLGAASNHIAMARALGMDPLVRVPDHGLSVIQRVLDAGAAGVVVPHVDTAEQARAVVRATCFPPRGDRGSGSTSRAGRWGLLPRTDYLEYGNEQALCVVQLESEVAIRNAKQILALDGIGAGFVGTADLSMSMGVPAGSDEVDRLVTSALAAAAAAGVPLGTACATSDQALAALDRGYDYVVVSNDTSILAAGARAIVNALKATAR
ncbi:HpcH/HpaI aldolase family protein [Paractinoplanes brasiliensis]|uniref:2-dehydro-3-deoxyglucarate aldolase/4-hydroxy-2-oxoheptanedioate aldolase n=1 Tax=Paractinoplanes brasiliensis TaxID=52695 RepID=A0A4R6JK90_9ACTN|nr:aldolase/citrate lyase family protein [Actinoplanes brasiliensis]TDO36624.1 2-dehydro-3-deoxyglucarate aldolase/4-hydroxy-2-oxoheptanedioate aldolase [Actinoplanes brasiliensis]GID32409.1 2-keto-3-deoxy-L-rhamnonate aldolase [Actinoplanes brasiliensis]